MTQERVKELARAQFGRTAKRYVDSRTHAGGWDLDQMVQWLQPNETWITLDVATGGGHTAKVLAPHVGQVIASDLTPLMLDAARQHLLESQVGNVLYVLADAETLPFLDGTFDAVTCRIAAHHFPHPERFVSEVRRVLKRGGRFVLIDNVAPDDAHQAQYLNAFEQLRDPSHIRCLSTAEWKSLFAAAGLRMERELTRRSPYDFQPWVRRMATSEAQVQAVEALLLQADDACREAFAIDSQAGAVQSLQVSRWMSMALA